MKKNTGKTNVKRQASKQSKDVRHINMRQFQLNIGQYERLFIVDVTDVPTQHISNLREDLGSRGVLDMGKNTIVKKALRDYIKNNGEKASGIAPLLDLLCGNVGVLFTNMFIDELETILAQHFALTYLKENEIAKENIILKKQITNTVPYSRDLNLFHKLKIPTKINKGYVNISQDFEIIKAGRKVNATEASLLQVLGLKPCKRRIEITCAYEYGTFYLPSELEKTIDLDDALRNAVGLCWMTATRILREGEFIVPKEEELPLSSTSSDDSDFFGFFS
jgi:large subunit ribosomal protein LP0